MTWILCIVIISVGWRIDNVLNRIADALEKLNRPFYFGYDLGKENKNAP